MSGVKGNRNTPGHSRASGARAAGRLALGSVGVLVLISLVALPAQYLFNLAGAPAGTPAPAVAQTQPQRPARTPRQTVEPSPAPAQPAAPTDTVEPSPSPTALPTSTHTPTPTRTPAPTRTPSPQPTPAPTDTPVPTLTPTPEPTPTPTPLSVARVTPASGTPAVNLRFGPGLGYAVVGVLRQGEFITVTGTVKDRGWWRVDLNGRPAWVSARVVRLDGDPQSVEIVPAAEIPRLPPPAQPTATPAG